MDNGYSMFFLQERSRNRDKTYSYISKGGNMLKPEWTGFEIIIIDKKAHEKHKCNSCDTKCIITTRLSEEPPNECLYKDRKGGDYNARIISV